MTRSDVCKFYQHVYPTNNVRIAYRYLHRAASESGGAVNHRRSTAFVEVARDPDEVLSTSYGMRLERRLLRMEFHRIHRQIQNRARASKLRNGATVLGNTERVSIVVDDLALQLRVSALHGTLVAEGARVENDLLFGAAVVGADVRVWREECPEEVVCDLALADERVVLCDGLAEVLLNVLKRDLDGLKDVFVWRVFGFFRGQAIAKFVPVVEEEIRVDLRSRREITTNIKLM